MNLTEVSAVAEIFASIGVILSLIFVGLQVRSSNRETRASTYQATVQTEMDVNTTLATHAATWDKVVTGQSLEPGEENRRAINLFNLLMSESENRYQQFNNGYLEPQAWEASKNSLCSLAHLPIYDLWRESIGALAHSRDFLELMDKLRSDNPPG